MTEQEKLDSSSLERIATLLGINTSKPYFVEEIERRINLASGLVAEATSTHKETCRDPECTFVARAQAFMKGDAET